VSGKLISVSIVGVFLVGLPLPPAGGRGVRQILAQIDQDRRWSFGPITLLSDQESVRYLGRADEAPKSRSQVNDPGITLYGYGFVWEMSFLPCARS